MKNKFFKKEYVLSIFNGGLVDLPTPSSLSYLWGFGSLLGVFLLFQIITGVFLSIHFSGDMWLSFSSVIHIMRDVNYGWFIRVIHSNGASMFFLFLYFHFGRGFYYGGYKMMNVWMSGVTIFLLSMATAFLGYVLPWGQMSFWAATVITNLLSAVPYFGDELVKWVWGGFAVGNPTLIRFFSFHFILPFVIVAIVIVHMMYLHSYGSSNPLGIKMNMDKIPFHIYFSVKDLIGFVMGFFVLMWISFLSPFMFMDCENFIISNPMVTPVHIQPEWYFLFAYAILRSVPSKVGGVLALFISVMMLYLFPFIFCQKMKSMSMYFFGKVMYWIFISSWLVLTWIGSSEVDEPYSSLSIVFGFLYFIMVCVIMMVMKIQDEIM